MRPNQFCLKAVLGAVSGVLVLGAPAGAQLSNIGFEGPNYPVGPLVTVNGGGMFTNTNGWQFETPGQAGVPTSFSITNSVHSPLGGGTQALAITHTVDGRRVGVDFATPVTSG